MKKNALFLLLLFLLSCHNPKSKENWTAPITDTTKVSVSKTYIKLTKEVPMNSSYKLAFTTYDKKFDTYGSPVIITERDTNKIQFHNKEDLAGFSSDVDISPNGLFILINRVERGYVNNNILHENTFCYLINLQEHKMEEQFQSQCDGEWNDESQWIGTDGELLFSP